MNKKFTDIINNADAELLDGLLDSVGSVPVSEDAVLRIQQRVTGTVSPARHPRKSRTWTKWLAAAACVALALAAGVTIGTSLAHKERDSQLVTNSPDSSPSQNLVLVTDDMRDHPKDDKTTPPATNCPEENTSNGTWDGTLDSTLDDARAPVVEPSVTEDPIESDYAGPATSAPTATALPQTDTTPPQPLSPPAQPIDFESYAAILNFIQNYDGTGDSCPEANAAWPDEFVDKYLEMNERFIKEGFFYEIVNSPDSEISRYVLFPNANYEDIGVCCYIVYGEIMYQCIVCGTKDDYDLFGEGHSLYEYMKWRMNNPNLREDIRDKTQSREVLRYDGGKKDGSYSYMEMPIDNTHYLTIRSWHASYEQIMNIYRSIELVKRPIAE